MLCKSPYVVRGQAFGCGQCLPCRINRRRIWAHRIMLEASQYEDNCFLTLTYGDEHLPSGNNLDPLALTLFLKRLRKFFDTKFGRKFRYFGVGEYGDQSERPHYHLALFGFPNCQRGRTSPRRNGSCCEICDSVRSVWGLGNVYLGSLEHQSASYVAGYVTKKLTAKDDPRLEGRHPEFARMSNRPGIGAGVMDEVASTILTQELEIEDVPTTLRHGSKQYPLGRYLRQNLRKKLGREEKTPEAVLNEVQEKLRPLQELAKATAPRGFKDFYFKNLIIDAGEGGRVRMESRYKRQPKRGSL